MKGKKKLDILWKYGKFCFHMVRMQLYNKSFFFSLFFKQTRFQSYRRQSAPSMVISKALTRSKTLSRYVIRWMQSCIYKRTQRQLWWGENSTSGGWLLGKVSLNRITWWWDVWPAQKFVSLLHGFYFEGVKGQHNCGSPENLSLGLNQVNSGAELNIWYRKKFPCDSFTIFFVVQTNRRFLGPLSKAQCES